MRITQNSLFNNLRHQIQKNTQQLLRAQEQVATQKKINRLSDNPIDGGRVLDLKSAVARADQYLKNIERVSSSSDVLDKTYDQAGSILARAKELLLQETNEVTSTTTTREAARTEISILTSQMVQLGNTKFNGNYVFSGFETLTPAYNEASVAVTPISVTGGEQVSAQQVIDPTQMKYHLYQIQFISPSAFSVFDTTVGVAVLSNQTYAAGAAIQFDGMSITLQNGAGGPQVGDTFNVATTPPGQYQGDGQTQFVEIQSGTTVPQNTPGNRVFNGTGLAGGVNVFGILNQINTALRNNDQTQMRGLLDQLDKAQTQISNERSINGARANLVSGVQAHQSDLQTNLKILSSNLEDVDVAEAATALQKQQDVYIATLGAASKIVQPSLLDFLK